MAFTFFSFPYLWSVWTFLYNTKGICNYNFFIFHHWSLSIEFSLNYKVSKVDNKELHGEDQKKFRKKIATSEN